MVCLFVLPFLSVFLTGELLLIFNCFSDKKDVQTFQLLCYIDLLDQ